MNFEKLNTKLQIKYYNNLINHCKKTNINYSSFNDKIIKLSQLQDSLSESDVNEIINDNTSKNKAEVYSDDYLYKKKWTKLSNIHKIIKIKEFVSKLLIDNNVDRDNLKNELVELVKSKKLTKTDQVNYDCLNGKVIAIPILTFKNGKYVINT